MTERYGSQSEFDGAFQELVGEMPELQLLTSTQEQLQKYVDLLRRNGFSDEEIVQVVESTGVEGFELSNEGGDVWTNDN